jgi:hypothetical protein
MRESCLECARKIPISRCHFASSFFSPNAQAQPPCPSEADKETEAENPEEPEKTKGGAVG